MKTIFFLFALAVLPNDVSAAPRQLLLDSTITVDKREISHPRCVINDGQEAMMGEGGGEGQPPKQTLRLKPKMSRNGAVLVEVDASYKLNDRTLSANVYVGAELGKPFRVPLNDESDHQLGELKIIVTEVKN